MAHRHRLTPLRFLILAIALLYPTLAQASSGYLKGTLRFHQKNGNYCPTGSDCTDSRYPSTAWNQQVGIPEAKIRLEKADGTLIAITHTDAAGNYALPWSSGTGSANVSAQIVLLYWHKDNAFQFRTVAYSGSKAQYFSKTTAFTLTHGTTSSQPQTHDWRWGTSAAPGGIANSYWAAYMAHRYVLRDLSRFTNVDVMAFDTAGLTGAECSNSCALGYPVNVTASGARPPWADQRLTVVLDGDASTPYWPVERTTHELGHIGDFVTVVGGHKRHTGTGYNGNYGWYPWTEEYRPSALTEGLASFIGVAAFYGDRATDPRTCTANGNSSDAHKRHCYAGTSENPLRVEESHNGSCASKEGRYPISATRFFWDLYDESADGSDDIDSTDATILTVMSSWPCSGWPTCYGDGQLHDQFSYVNSTVSSTIPSAAELDDGNAWHWRTTHLNNTGVDAINVFNLNCMGYW